MTIADALNDFRDPYLDASWAELGVLANIESAGAGYSVGVRLGYPAQSLVAGWQAQLSEAVGAPVTLEVGLETPALSVGPNVSGVRNIIAVASGKGGVGKSTTAVNLAAALDAEGAKVGILDADIYGPSLAMMLGVAPDTRPTVQDEKFFVPVKAHGLEAMSMSFLVTESTPMVWRGPMASGALQQMLSQALWGDLDYLIVDMPPGTGDIQLTLSQRASLAGAVIVTTPQDIALADARKGIEMFAKVDVPVLGVIENMGLHICPSCGHESHIFGDGGGERIAHDYGSVLLGQLPLDPSIREQTDAGRPTVIAEPDGRPAQLYRDAARHMAARLWQGAMAAASAPQITISED